MGIMNLTKEKLDNLIKKRDMKIAELEKYNHITIKQLWLNELDELEKFYDKWNNQLIENKNNLSKKYKKPITKKSKKNNI